jgi:hypothetical protein
MTVRAQAARAIDALIDQLATLPPDQPEWAARDGTGTVPVAEQAQAARSHAQPLADRAARLLFYFATRPGL